MRSRHHSRGRKVAGYVALARTTTGYVLPKDLIRFFFQRKDQSEKPPPDDPGNPTVDFHGERRSTTKRTNRTAGPCWSKEGLPNGNNGEVLTEYSNVVFSSASTNW